MLYRILQRGQRNAVRISMAGRHTNRAYSAIDSRSEDATFGYRFRNLMAPASKLAHGCEASVQSGCLVGCYTGAGESGCGGVKSRRWKRAECRINESGRPRAGEAGGDLDCSERWIFMWER